MGAKFPWSNDLRLGEDVVTATGLDLAGRDRRQSRGHPDEEIIGTVGRCVRSHQQIGGQGIGDGTGAAQSEQHGVIGPDGLIAGLAAVLINKQGIDRCREGKATGVAAGESSGMEEVGLDQYIVSAQSDLIEAGGCRAGEVADDVRRLTIGLGEAGVDEGVIPSSTIELIGTRSPLQEVLASATAEDVIAQATDERVIEVGAAQDLGVAAAGAAQSTPAIGVVEDIDPGDVGAAAQTGIVGHGCDHYIEEFICLQ